jgi:hypothetical protein
MVMSIKLTETQIVMLNAAAQREDRCFIAHPSLKGGAAQKVAAKLIGGRLARRSKQNRERRYGGKTREPDNSMR